MDTRRFEVLGVEFLQISSAVLSTVRDFYRDCYP